MYPRIPGPFLVTRIPRGGQVDPPLRIHYYLSYPYDLGVIFLVFNISLQNCN